MGFLELLLVCNLILIYLGIGVDIEVVEPVFDTDPIQRERLVMSGHALIIVPVRGVADFDLEFHQFALERMARVYGADVS